MLQEREELTSIIFFALIFSDLVKDALDKDKNKQNMVHAIKVALDPICARMEIPKKDKERLIKIFASQKRFFKTEETNPSHNEVFRKKDFFYEAFMVYKINALAEKHEQAIQSAFFWEISTRNRPKPSQRIIHNESAGGERERFRNFRNDRKPKRFNKQNSYSKDHVKESHSKENHHKDLHPKAVSEEEVVKNHHAEPQELDRNVPEEIREVEIEETVVVESSTEANNTNPQPQKERKPFRRNRYRNRFRRYGNKNKKTQGERSKKTTVKEKRE